MPRIPDILCKEGYRFIKIKKRGKPAIEKNWPTSNNYTHDSPELDLWISRGGNYGVMPRGGIIILDVDDYERFKELNIVNDESEKQTLTVKTGGGGKHYYFKIDDSSGLPDKIIMFDKEKKDDDGEPIHLGEIYIRGNIYVVGPNSIHPNGSTYELVGDREPVTITVDRLKDILSRVDWNDPEKIIEIKIDKKERAEIGTSLTEVLGINIEDVCRPENAKSSINEIIGAHPVHGSKTGNNLSINPSKNQWHCFRCNSGGDPITWIAVEAGIIQCGDAHAGCLEDPEIFKQVIEELERRGYKIPKKTRKIKAGSVRTFEKHIVLDELPPVADLETGPEYILINGMPRTGKTFNMMSLCMNTPFTVNYVTNRHSINKQAFELTKRIAKRSGSTKSVVWLAGKSFCCVNDEVRSSEKLCKDCPMHPNKDGYSIKGYENKAEQMINEYQFLDKEIIVEKESTMCPYYILKGAERLSDVCLTVPYYLTSSDDEQRLCSRELTIIDEDSTIDNFYPGSLELASYVNVRGNLHFEHSLARILSATSKLKQVVETKDGVEKKTRLQKWDKVMLAVIDKIEELDALFESYREGNVDIKKLEEDVKKFNTEILLNGHKIDYDTKIKTVEKVEEYEHNLPKVGDDYTLAGIFETFLFQWEKKPLVWIGANLKKLYLIGDERKLIRKFETEKLIVIGFTKAEMFIEDVRSENPGEIVKYEIKGFKYGKNFITIRVGHGLKDTEQERMFRRFLSHAKTENEDALHAVPCLVLTSSKDKQRGLIDRYSSMFNPIKKEGINRIRRKRYQGAFEVFYANSSISRGIDVDMYDVIFAESTDFANPYYDAVIKVSKSRNDNIALEEAMVVRDSMTVDEITNSILRPSPVAGGLEEQAKFLVIKSKDFDKVHQNVSKDMYIFELNEMDNTAGAWDSIKKGARKVNMEVDEGECMLVPGKSWNESRLDFDAVKKGDVEYLSVKKKIDENSKNIIKSTATGIINTLGHRISQDAITKLIKSSKGKHLKDSKIFECLTELTVERKIKSEFDSKKLKRFYSAI